MLKKIFCTFPLWIGRKIFGRNVTSAVFAYLFAALMFGAGLIVGFSIDQPLATAAPARHLLEVSSRIEQRLLTSQVAIVGKAGSAEVDNALAAARRDIRAESERLRQQTVSSDGPVATAYDQGRRFLNWLGPTLFAAFVLLVLFIAALFHPGFRSAFMRSGSVTIGSVTINLKDISSVRETLRERHAEVDQAISKTYLEKLLAYDVEKLFADVKIQINSAFKSHLGVELDSVPHRATLYVPGFFGDELVQAAGYLGAKMNVSRTGTGRRFSVRYGIIGKAWRLRRSQYNWDVNNKEQNLIRNWGLTFQEASRQGVDSKSLMTFVIPEDPNKAFGDQGDPLAVIYIEAEGQKSLSPAKTEAELIAKLSNGLLKADELAENIWRRVDWHVSMTKLREVLIALRHEFDWDRKIVSADGR